MTPKEQAALAVETLKKEYPDSLCSLTYSDPLQLLIATRLSAQCTDARVNKVTPILFSRFPTLESFVKQLRKKSAGTSTPADFIKQKHGIFVACAG